MTAVFSPGVSVHWLGDFVFVESGLGVRVKFDMRNTVYLTVTAEHLTTTRGLCGVYNNKPDGTLTNKQTTKRLSWSNSFFWAVCGFLKSYISPDLDSVSFTGWCKLSVFIPAC